MVQSTINNTVTQSNLFGLRPFGPCKAQPVSNDSGFPESGINSGLNSFEFSKERMDKREQHVYEGPERVST